jgi:hypothetical protein
VEWYRMHKTEVLGEKPVPGFPWRLFYPSTSIYITQKDAFHGSKTSHIVLYVQTLLLL